VTHIEKANLRLKLEGLTMCSFIRTESFRVFLASLVMVFCQISCVQRQLNEARQYTDDASDPSVSETKDCELDRKNDSGLAAFKNLVASVVGKFPAKKATGTCLSVALIANLYATPLLANSLLPATLEPCSIATAGGENLRQLDQNSIEVLNSLNPFLKNPNADNNAIVPLNIDARCELPGDVVPVMPDRSKEKIARLELARIVTAHALVGLKAIGTSDQKLAAKYLLHYLMGCGKPLDVSRYPAIAASVVKVFMHYWMSDSDLEPVRKSSSDSKGRFFVTYWDYQSILNDKRISRSAATEGVAIRNTLGRFFLYYEEGMVQENGKRTVTLRIDDAYIWPDHYAIQGSSDFLMSGGNRFPEPFVNTLGLILGPYSNQYLDQGRISNRLWNDMKRAGNEPGAARDFNVILNTEIEI
jgi:hypothetical protein